MVLNAVVKSMNNLVRDDFCEVVSVCRLLVVESVESMICLPGSRIASVVNDCQ